MTDNHQLIRRNLDVELVVRAQSEGSDDRIIEGIVVPWDQPATVRSVGEAPHPAGTVYQEAIVRGATEGMNPERVTLESTDHGGKLVGRGITSEERDEGLHMAFRVARTAAGDELYELAREKVLTGMSIVFTPSAHRQRGGIVERTSINVHRVAVVENGAYADAQVSAVRAEPTPQPQETPKVEYITRDDKAARQTEVEQQLAGLSVQHPGVLPQSEQAKWDDLTAERSALIADIQAWDNRQATLSAFVKRDDTQPVPAHTEPGNGGVELLFRKSEGDIYDLSQYGPGHVRSIEDRDEKLHSNAMRAVERASFKHTSVVDQDKAKEGVEALIKRSDNEAAARILVTNSPIYEREFRDSLINMVATPKLVELQRAAALAVTGTTTTGGYMLPYTFDPSFIKTGAYTPFNPIRQIGRVEQITGSNRWEGVSVGAVPAIYETEALAVTEAGPTFARPAAVAQRASAFVSVSYETLQDRPDVINELADLIQEGKETLEEAQFTIGVGTTVYPQGLGVKSAYTVKETITNDTFAVADLDATEADLPIRHRASSVWLLSRAVIRIIQGWETAYGKYFESTLGYPAAGPLPAGPPGGNTGLSLLGHPVWEQPSMPTTVTTDDTIVGLLFNPKTFLVLDRVGMNVELVPNLIDGNGKVTGQRGVFAMFRNTTKVLNVDGGRQININ